MTTTESRLCNSWSLETVARYLGVPNELLQDYYRELQEDTEFLRQLNERIELGYREYNYHAGLFRKGTLDCIEWFGGQRIFLYVLIRWLRPNVAVETGVLYGGTTAFILRALDRNQQGKLISIDLPAAAYSPEEEKQRHSLVGDSERLPNGFAPGFIVPNALRSRWEYKEGDSHIILPQLTEKVDFFCHDSEHSHHFMRQELEMALALAQPGALIMADDIDWSNGFWSFCVDHRLMPLVLPDNGKDGLRMRTGITWLQHPLNGNNDSTGALPRTNEN